MDTGSRAAVGGPTRVLGTDQFRQGSTQCCPPDREKGSPQTNGKRSSLFLVASESCTPIFVLGSSANTTGQPGPAPPEPHCWQPKQPSLTPLPGVSWIADYSRAPELGIRGVRDRQVVGGTAPGSKPLVSQLCMPTGKLELPTSRIASAAPAAERRQRIMFWRNADQRSSARDITTR
jgi:hypothetical protein